MGERNPASGAGPARKSDGLLHQGDKSMRFRPIDAEKAMARCRVCPACSM
jgi:hypothetical protein